METDNRSGPRYLASLEVKAEWDEPSGTHIVAEGTTENVGPERDARNCRDSYLTSVVTCVSKCSASLARSYKWLLRCFASNDIRDIHWLHFSYSAKLTNGEA